MKQETIRALEMLYGSSDVPVCAVGTDLTLLWCPDPRAEALVMLLGSERGGAETTERISLPQTENLLLRTARPPCICQMQQLSEDGKPFYLLRFLPCPAHRRFNGQEFRALLSAQAAADRQTALTLMQNALLSDSEHGNQPDSSVSMRMVPYYVLLNRTVRCEELLWYDAAESGQPAEFGCIPLTGCLTKFLEELSEAVGKVIQVKACSIADGLCAAVEPKRLHFALLLLVLQMQEAFSSPTLLELSAERTRTGSGEIRMEMRANRGTEAQALLRQRVVRDGTLFSDSTLLDCFCRTFGAQYTVQNEQDTAVCTLTLPPAPETPLLSLYTSVRRYTGSRSTLSHILLSETVLLSD